MGLLETLGIRRRQAAVVIRESVSDTGKWIKIGGGLRYNRDLGSADLYDLIDRAYRAWRLNPFVKRITEMWVNYVAGSGLTFTAKDERVQLVLNDFLSRNKIPQHMKQRGRDVFLCGELAGIPTINVSSGNVRIAFLPSMQIQKIEMNPMNGDEATALFALNEVGQPIRLPMVSEDVYGTAPLRIPEIYGDKRPPGFDAPLQTLGRKTGQAFYLGMNMILGATRGTSDLLTILDWCAGTEDLLWDMRSRAEKQNNVIGIITIKTATPAQLKKYRDKDSPEYIPPPGEDGSGWNWANENMSFSFVSPQLGSSDVAVAIRLFKNMISLGGGPPEHLMGEGDVPNRATAMEIGDPFYQLMASGQAEFCGFWQNIAEYAVDQKLIFTKELDGVTDTSVTVTGPDIATRDEERRATTAKSFTDTVVAWKMNALINDEQAIDLMNQIAQGCGLKVKVVEQQLGAAAKESWAQGALRRIKQQQGER